MKTDSRVDAYIAKAAPFAQAILNETRKRVGQASPSFEETIKWNVPFFLLDGKIIASMAAFKKHVKVGVWLGKKGTFQDVVNVAELMPAKEFADQVKAALKESGGAMTSGPAKKAAPKKAVAKKAPAKKTAKASVTKAPAKKAAVKKSAKKA